MGSEKKLAKKIQAQGIFLGNYKNLIKILEKSNIHQKTEKCNFLSKIQ
jgi:hypothetical protein